jgi:hypothetical protein
VKKCPFCAEEIQDEAIVCKHCGRDLRPQAAMQSITNEKHQKKWSLLEMGCEGWVGLFILVIIFFAFVPRLFGGGVSTSYNVTYGVTGTARGASITYENAQGGTEQGDVRIPWFKSYTMKYSDFAYISAQNNYDRGSVTCTITVNGKNWKTSTSSGAYVIADCSGLVGKE